MKRTIFLLLVLAIITVYGSIPSLLGVAVNLKNTNTVDSGGYLKAPLIGQLTNLMNRLAFFIGNDTHRITRLEITLAFTMALLIIAWMILLVMVFQVNRLSRSIMQQGDGQAPSLVTPKAGHCVIAQVPSRAEQDVSLRRNRIPGTSAMPASS